MGHILLLLFAYLTGEREREREREAKREEDRGFKVG